MATALHISPHPDDEMLGAGGTLLSLRNAGWWVVTLACSLGRADQQAQRRAELQNACASADFEMRETAAPISISAGDDLALAQTLLTQEVLHAIAEVKPALLVAPSPHDGHHGHEVVGRAAVQALESLNGGPRPRLWLWELWSMLPLPTLYVPVSAELIRRAGEALDAHVGELERNDYRQTFAARGGLAATLGVERVFGFGAPGRGDAHAEVLMELLCDRADRFPLAAPRALDTESPLEPAAARGTDARAWLSSVAARPTLLGE